MTEPNKILSADRVPWSRDQLKQVGAFVPALRPALRYVPKNPLLLIGAAVVGVAGVLAWRNREKIARTAGPLLDDAKVKGLALVDEAKVRGQALAHDAKVKGEALVDEAKVQGRKVGEKVAAARRSRTPTPSITEIH